MAARPESPERSNPRRLTRLIFSASKGDVGAKSERIRTPTGPPAKSQQAALWPFRQARGRTPKAAEEQRRPQGKLQGRHSSSFPCLLTEETGANYYTKCKESVLAPESLAAFSITHPNGATCSVENSVGGTPTDAVETTALPEKLMIGVLAYCRQEFLRGS